MKSNSGCTLVSAKSAGTIFAYVNDYILCLVFHMQRVQGNAYLAETLKISRV